MKYRAPHSNQICYMRNLNKGVHCSILELPKIKFSCAVYSSCFPEKIVNLHNLNNILNVILSGHYIRWLSNPKFYKAGYTYVT